jgi:hypothetical protein
MRAKRVLLVVAVATMLLGASGAAGASTITSEPSGAIRAVSEGSITFTSGLEGVACRMTLEGTIVREASGTLSEAPEPSTNPRIGSFTSGRASECTSVSGIALLFGAGRWDWYAFSVRGEVVKSYGLYISFLLRGPTWGCLWDQQWVFSFNWRTLKLTIEATRTLALMVLMPFCPTLSVAGGFTLEPRVVMSLS